MSSYEVMKQELPPYGQPGGYQQQPAQYMQQVPSGGQPANEVQHYDHEEPPPRRSGGRRGCAGGDDSEDEGGDKEDVLGPGELPDKALNVSI